jgi:hypothetical protein
MGIRLLPKSLALSLTAEEVPTTLALPLIQPPMAAGRQPAGSRRGLRWRHHTHEKPPTDDRDGGSEDSVYRNGIALCGGTNQATDRRMIICTRDDSSFGEAC